MKTQTQWLEPAGPAQQHKGKIFILLIFIYLAPVTLKAVRNPEPDPQTCNSGGKPSRVSVGGIMVPNICILSHRFIFKSPFSSLFSPLKTVQTK